MVRDGGTVAAQPEHLALDRAHGGVRGGAGPGREDHAAGRDLPLRRPDAGDAPGGHRRFAGGAPELHAAFARGAQHRGDEPPGVDLVVTGHEGPGHDGRVEQRFALPALRRAEALDLQAPLLLAAADVGQPGPVTRVERDEEGPGGPVADPQAGGLLDAGRVVGETTGGVQAQPQQRGFGTVHLADGGEHPGRGVRGPGTGFGVDEQDVQALFGQPPRAGGADDATPEHDDVVRHCHHSPFAGANRCRFGRSARSLALSARLPGSRGGRTIPPPVADSPGCRNPICATPGSTCAPTPAGSGATWPGSSTWCSRRGWTSCSCGTGRSTRWRNWSCCT